MKQGERSMSFPENDRIFQPHLGKSFHDPAVRPGVDHSFVLAVAGALKRDFGSNSGAVKRVALLANANQRAVRNWFEGKNGPSGEHLMALMRHSDMVLNAVLVLAHRQDLLAGLRLAQAKTQLGEALAMLESIGVDGP